MNQRVKLIRKRARNDARANGSTSWDRESRTLDDRNGQGGALVAQSQHSGSGIERKPRLARNGQGQHVQRRTRPDLLPAPHGQLAAVAERAALFDRGDGGTRTAVQRPGADQTRQFHPHPQPPQMRRRDLHRGRFDVSAAQKRRHRPLQAAARHRRRLLGRHVSCCRSTSTARST